MSEINKNPLNTQKHRELLKKFQYWESYYCGSDVGVFIGPVWVDDIVSIQYTKSNNKAPIFGYMSEKFDAVARGTYIVEGQFAIAYRDVDYLSKVLKQFDRHSINRILVGTEADPLDLDEDINYLNNDGSINLDVFDRNLKKPDRHGYRDGMYNMSVDRDGFDIYITYGDLSGSYRGGTVEVLNSVHITSQSVIASPSGEPIAEIYSFFAMDKGNHPQYPNYLRSDEIDENESERMRQATRMEGILDDVEQEPEPINRHNKKLRNEFFSNVNNSWLSLLGAFSEWNELLVDNEIDDPERSRNLKFLERSLSDRYTTYKIYYDEYERVFQESPGAEFVRFEEDKFSSGVVSKLQNIVS